jgi:hypothetical protein
MFSSLAIILLELCFGERLEDQPFRKRTPLEAADVKQALDIQAAIQWSHMVPGEAGEVYASAVRWCLLSSVGNGNESWRAGIIKNAIRPLEKCLEHLGAIAML